MKPDPERRFHFQKHVLLFGFLISLHLLLNAPAAFAETKDEVLRKYETVIAKANELVIYGYDLRDLESPLKQAAHILLENNFEQANRVLDELARNLEILEATGSERTRQKRRLAWLEVLIDLIQQIAIFAVVAVTCLRFPFLRRSLEGARSGRIQELKLILLLIPASFLSGSIGFIRYGQSSWSFVDLELLFVGLSGAVGGLWVGLATGMTNSALRFWMVPDTKLYAMLPMALGFVMGFASRLWKGRPIRNAEILAGGMLIGLSHSLSILAPMHPYLPLRSLVLGTGILTAAECGIFSLFFLMARHRLREEKRKETEKELFQTRLKFLQAQINPHFLFNALNTIAAVCGEDGSERARNLVVKLSTLFRRMTKQEGDLVPLQEELECIDAYLSIEQVRFGEKLKVERNIKLSTSGLHALVPILVLQPIVENAVKHGLSKKTEGGTLTIEAEEFDSIIRISIRDTGIGMPQETASQTDRRQKMDEHTGIGLANIRERLAKLFGNRFELAVTSIPERGTTVSLTLPKTPSLPL